LISEYFLRGTRKQQKKKEEEKTKKKKKKIIFRKSVEKIQVSLKYDKNNGYFTCRPMYIYGNISLSSS